MRTDELTSALRAAAAAQPTVVGDPQRVLAGARGRHRRRMAVVAGATSVLLVSAASIAAWQVRQSDDANVQTGSGLVAEGGEWVELPASPLSPRAQVVGVWTGEEAIFMGGDTFLCPPSASCLAPEDPPLADGAALDPATGTWRRIASAPVPFDYASTAVIGDDVYALSYGRAGGGAPPAFLRYSISGDSWTELPIPQGDLGWYSLIAAGEHLVAYSGSDEQGVQPDQGFDRLTSTWSELTPDPLGSAFGRSMVWAEPHLYLFDEELVPQPGSEGPSLVRAARLDLAGGTWERLPDSEILGSGMVYLGGDSLVNPRLDTADGGGVGPGGWDRPYPYGGVLSIDRREWSPLPPVSGEHSSAGAIGPEGMVVYGTYGGLLLDVEAMAWVEMPGLEPTGTYERRNVLSAGPDAIAFGGERWSDGAEGGELLADAWIWRSRG